MERDVRKMMGTLSLISRIFAASNCSTVDASRSPLTPSRHACGPSVFSIESTRKLLPTGAPYASGQPDGIENANIRSASMRA